VASLKETVAGLVPQEAESTAWRKSIAEDCARLLEHSVVIK